MSFVWPPNGNYAYVVSSTSVNIFDTLETQYTSTWNALNFTLFCKIGDVSTDYGVWTPPSNPMAASGTFRLNSIYTADFGIVKFPTHCAFRITEYGNADVYNAGQFFEVISEPGVSTTWRSTSVSSQTSTSVAKQSSANVAAATSISDSRTTTIHSAHASSSAFGTTDAASPASSTTSDLSAEQVGLSTGTKVGIGIGIALAVLVIVALSSVVIRLRRRLNRPMEEGTIKLQPELSAYPSLIEQKPTYTYGMQELEQTSRVELPNQPRRFGPPELEGSMSFRPG